MGSRSIFSGRADAATPGQPRHVSCSRDEGALATSTKRTRERRTIRTTGWHRWSALRRCILTASIVATASLVVWVGLDVGRLLVEGAWFAVVLGVIAGAFAIDFVTGLVHFACDRFGHPKTPVVGPLLIKAFRDHHQDPYAIVEHDWIETNGESCVLTMLALIVLAFVAPTNAGFGAAAFTTVWTMATLGAFANQAHKWAHMRNAPRMVRFFQRAGLTLSPDEHARHHHAPHDKAYCITNGWMNPMLDRLGLWSWLERSLKGMT